MKDFNWLRLLYSSDYQKDQVLVFCEGQLKAGGQREEKGRQRKRPHQAPLIPANHFLPDAFFQAEPIEQEDGELTNLEVTANVVCTCCLLCQSECFSALQCGTLLSPIVNIYSCVKVRDGHWHTYLEMDNMTAPKK